MAGGEAGGTDALSGGTIRRARRSWGLSAGGQEHNLRGAELSRESRAAGGVWTHRAVCARERLSRSHQAAIISAGRLAQEDGAGCADQMRRGYGAGHGEGTGGAGGYW